MKYGKYAIILYLVIGLLVGLYRLLDSRITSAYTTGNMKRPTFWDEVLMVVVPIVAWPITLIKSFF